MKSFAVFVTLMVIASTVSAAEIYVRGTRGAHLSQIQKERITAMVKRSVKRMPEHTLVQSEKKADFVLIPAIVHRGNQLVLRIAKYKDGEIIGQGEEIVPSLARSSRKVYSATETALNADIVASLDRGTQSGSTSSVDRDAPTIHESAVENKSDTASAKPDVSEVRAPSPIRRSDRLGSIQLGVGPAFSTGLRTDQALYAVTLGYISPYNEYLSGKIFGELNVGGGGDASRFNELGIGAEVFPWTQTGKAAPYVVGDVGYAFTRDSRERTLDAPALGAGAGYKFAAQQLNMDVNLHYAALLAQLDGQTPTVLGIRAAFNF